MHPEPENVSVPWTGLDVLLFLALWFAALVISGVVAAVANIAIPSPPEQPVAKVEVEKKDHGHPVFQLIEHGKTSPAVLLIIVLCTVVAAPLVEELLFRLLFQGWLTATLNRSRIPHASVIAIGVVSVCFALVHAGNCVALDRQTLFFMLGALAVANLFVFLLGIIYLSFIRNVSISRYFFGSGQYFPPHFFTYAGYCLLALVFIFGVSTAFDQIYPDANTDPIPIFLFALLLGTLYSKTQNLSYCILLHALLNGTNLIIAWLTV
jgi:membrane protease YdiL (CAAX protease family)